MKITWTAPLLAILLFVTFRSCRVKNNKLFEVKTVSVNQHFDGRILATYIEFTINSTLLITPPLELYIDNKFKDTLEYNVSTFSRNRRTTLRYYIKKGQGKSLAELESENKQIIYFSSAHLVTNNQRFELVKASECPVFYILDDNTVSVIDSILLNKTIELPPMLPPP